ncbi:MAG TPA: DUF2283 domain-containing protein [Planctomycetota bacterium]|nr:DUF2283 domain-containing protein [Planctomycetota bacterium]
MTKPFLEVTYRKGRPLAAYFYLARRRGDRSYRTVPIGDGMLVDYSEDGRPIGIEMTAPAKASLERLNKIMRDLGVPPNAASLSRQLLGLPFVTRGH